MNSIKVGATYEVTRGTRKQSLRVLGRDDVQKSWVVCPAQGGPSTYFDFKNSHRLQRVSSRAAKIVKRKADPTSTCLLYVMKVADNVYKAGCTSDLAKRVKAAETWCPEVKVVATRRIPGEVTNNWRMYELALLKHMKTMNPTSFGKEVARLTPSQLEEVKSFLKSCKW